MLRAACAVSFVFCLCSVAWADAPLEGLDIITATGLHHYEVEIANDEPTREHGLMDRHEMAANHGMLFEFPEPAPVTFWMTACCRETLPVPGLYPQLAGTRF